jgi:hypothetical protein
MEMGRSAAKSSTAPLPWSESDAVHRLDGDGRRARRANAHASPALKI